MSQPWNYSKTVFSQGVMCFNTNNNEYCVVIDGRKGTEEDRCSLVLEFCGEFGFIVHTPPNRALIPTGKTLDLRNLARILYENVAFEEKKS